MKLCKCGCGDKVKHPSSTYLRGHSNRDPKVKEKKRLTSLKNYGVENPNQSKLIKQKKKTTNLKNLGVENPSQSRIIQNKKIETSEDRYGVKYPNQSETIKNKTKTTLLERYGVDHISKIEEVKKKKIRTCLKNWNTKNPGQSNIIKNKMKQTCLKKYGVDHYTKTPEGRKICREHFIKMIETQKLNGEPLSPRIGNNERQCIDELQKYSSYNIIRNHKIIGYFPDGFIEELNLVIEFDESWHSGSWAIEHDNKKNLDFEAEGYAMFRIKEKLWYQYQNKVINQFSTLMNKLKI